MKYAVRLVLLIALVFVAGPSWAQEGDSILNGMPIHKAIAREAQRLALTTAVQEIQASASVKPKKTADALFWTVAVNVGLLTWTDIDSTYIYKSRCPKAYEFNPIMAPFFDIGSKWQTYAVVGGINALIVYVGYEIKKDPSAKWSNWWWVPAGAAIVGHGISTIHNMSASNSCLQ